MRARTALTAAVLLLGPLASVSPVASAAGAASDSTPRWVLHAQRYPGGISNGVRAALTAGPAAPRARPATTPTPVSPATGPNVQMNDDSNPPMPQNETSVAVDLTNPMVAVAGANDYVNEGVAVMRTADGGRTWRTTRIVPVFQPSRDVCTGGDPALAYSRRDRAFYLAQLCFFRTLPFSEIQVYKSVDGGRTWTPGRAAAVAATNFNSETGEVDESIFHDKEWITVDNTPTSPFYGRIYVTWTKFHIQPNGFSDYCPIQLASTDVIPTFNPSLTVWRHTSVVPDNPGGRGRGESANQFSVPQVDTEGVVDVSYVLEECNTSIDYGLRYQKSFDGGRTFLPRPIHIDQPGEFVDNPNPADQLPPTVFRAPNTTAHAISPRTGTRVFVYTNYAKLSTKGGDIAFQVSRDEGRHWGPLRILSTQAGRGAARNDQFFPWVTVDERGVFHAVWFDRRRDPANRRIDTWYARSTDDARSWTSWRISTESWNPDRGFFTSGAFIGDYNGIAAWRGFVYPVWTDGRNNAITRTGIGETDIFTTVALSR